MKIINSDYKSYIDSMDNKDLVIIDPPWNYKNKPPRTKKSLSYDLWDDNTNGLNIIFSKIKCKCLLLWVTNGMLIDVFKANHYNFIYHNCITWVKLYGKGGLFWGMGNTLRGATEHILFFYDKNENVSNILLDNLYIAKAGSRTLKPKEIEYLFLKEFSKNGYNKSAYIFSGFNLDMFVEFDIDCVDTVSNK